MKLPAGAAALLAEAAVRPLAATWRWRSLPAGAARGRPVRPPLPLEPAVYALWHEHLLPLALAHRDQGVTALVSRHRDGEILASVLDRLGQRAARGSSTRGGAEGLAAMIRDGRDGRPLAFTPDGPRGPARRCKPGVVRAAAETGRPIVPLGAAASAGRRLASWDRFLVPAPGARVVVSRGAPLHVPSAMARPEEGGAEDGSPELTGWTRRVERAIEAERRRCEEAVGEAVR